MQLKDIIAQQPDPSFKLNQTICPYCNGTDVKERGKETTCVGHLGTRPEDDPNHVWVFCECQKCMKEFTTFTARKPRNLFRGGIAVLVDNS